MLGSAPSVRCSIACCTIMVRDKEAGGSNPLARPILFIRHRLPPFAFPGECQMPTSDALIARWSNLSAVPWVAFAEFLHASPGPAIARISSPREDVAASFLQLRRAHCIRVDNRFLQPGLCRAEIDVPLRRKIVSYANLTAPRTINKHRNNAAGPSCMREIDEAVTLASDFMLAPTLRNLYANHTIREACCFLHTHTRLPVGRRRRIDGSPGKTPPASSQTEQRKNALWAHRVNNNCPQPAPGTSTI